MITVSAKYFAILKELGGVSEDVFELPDGSSGLDLLKQIAERRPALKSMLNFVRLANDETYLDNGHVLEDGTTVLIIPPVSGG